MTTDPVHQSGNGQTSPLEEALDVTALSQSDDPGCRPPTVIRSSLGCCLTLTSRTLPGAATPTSPNVPAMVSVYELAGISVFVTFMSERHEAPRDLIVARRRSTALLHERSANTLPLVPDTSVVHDDYFQSVQPYDDGRTDGDNDEGTPHPRE